MSTNSTFNLNFRLKFLKFREWSLDSYDIIKVLIILLEKNHRIGGEAGSQATKKASEVPAGPGTDTCSVQHLSENDLLLKGRGFKGRVGQGSGGKGSPPPHFSFG